MSYNACFWRSVLHWSYILEGVMIASTGNVSIKYISRLKNWGENKNKNKEIEML